MHTRFVSGNNFSLQHGYSLKMAVSAFAYIKIVRFSNKSHECRSSSSAAHEKGRNYMYQPKTPKRALAGLMSAAMLAVSLPTAAAPTVYAEDASNNYGEALAMSLYFYDSNACGSGITGGPLTWRGDCHTYDGQAPVGSLSGEAKAIVDPDGDGKVDLDGGYHDAGDHIKFNLTIGFAMNSLALSEYLNPGVYQKAGAFDHLQYVLKRGADFMMKSTFLNESGEVVAVAGTVADGNVDHGIFIPPEEQTYQRDVYWLTASDNNSAVVCEMAAGLGGTAYIFQNTDPEYAAKCIKYAKALRAFGNDHVGNNCNGMSFYSTNSMYQDEDAMAAGWLWINGAGDKPTYSPTGNGKYTGGGDLADYYRYCWDKVWQGYAAMMYQATKDDAFKQELIFEVNNAKGVAPGTYNGDGWGAARYNCALQMSALAIAGDDAESEYAVGAKWQMDYILGGNPKGYSFLLGYGDKWPVHIHHRAAQHLAEGQSLVDNPTVKYTNYGTLVGGIDASGNYEDHSDKYQYTEPALDYNGCFALACAGLYKLFGGDASALDAVKESASEINAGFKFSSGDVVITTEPSETTTTDTTTTTTETSTTSTTTETSTTSTTTETSTTSSGENFTVLRGDVNVDNLVNVKDAVLLARYVGNESVVLSDQALRNAELDGNDSINTDDLTKLLRIIANLDT